MVAEIAERSSVRSRLVSRSETARVSRGWPRVLREYVQQAIDPVRRQFFDRLIDARLPPGRNVGEIFFLKTMFDDIKGIVSIEDDVEWIFDTRRTRARSIESEKSHLQREVHAGVEPQDAVEQWFTVSCFANDAVRRALAHLYPVPLWIDKKELMFVVIFQLSSHEGVEVKD